jgi:hypothetical protein
MITLNFNYRRIRIVTNYTVINYQYLDKLIPSYISNSIFLNYSKYILLIIHFFPLNDQKKQIQTASWTSTSGRWEGTRQRWLGIIITNLVMLFNNDTKFAMNYYKLSISWDVDSKNSIFNYSILYLLFIKIGMVLIST